MVFNVPLIGRLIPNIGMYLFNIFLIFHIFSLIKYDFIIVHYAFHVIPIWFFKKKIIILSHGVDWDPDGSSIKDKISHFITSKTLNNYIIVSNDSHYYRTLGINAKPGEKFHRELVNRKWFIPNCVDCNIFKPGSPILEFKNRKIILVPRQITRDRGIHLAIEAFTKFCIYEKNFELLIVGPVRSYKYKNLCDSLIQEHGLAKESYLEA